MSERIAKRLGRMHPAPRSGVEPVLAKFCSGFALMQAGMPALQSGNWSGKL